jgi:hypothetical protein
MIGSYQWILSYCTILSSKYRSLPLVPCNPLHLAPIQRLRCKGNTGMGTGTPSYSLITHIFLFTFDHISWHTWDSKEKYRAHASVSIIQMNSGSVQWYLWLIYWKLLTGCSIQAVDFHTSDRFVLWHWLTCNFWYYFLIICANLFFTFL